MSCGLIRHVVEREVSPLQGPFNSFFSRLEEMESGGLIQSIDFMWWCHLTILSNINIYIFIDGSRSVPMIKGK